MSDADDQQHDDPEEADGPRLDASYKVDSAALGGEEADFAKQMGFGEDGNEGAGDEAQSDTSLASPDPLVQSDPEPEQESQAEADEVVPRGIEDSDGHAPEQDEALPRADSGARTGDWEDIAPRPASEGIQTTIQARADELLGRDEAGLHAANGGAAAGDAAEMAALREQHASLEERCGSLQRQLATREDELEALREGASTQGGGPATTRAELEKAVARLEVELEGLALERDQLIDQLASARDQLSRSETRSASLELSVRAARGALTPLPEGERALRAEVVALRGRLEDAEEESARLTRNLSERTTELAIAEARVEDRQHEIDAHSERTSELEASVAEHATRTADALDEHREMLALSGRLQAENNELRSTQMALEETLQARDLEIAAREEHLTVTREGLAGRDAQIIDLGESLVDQQRANEALEAELQRRQLEVEQLEARVAMRESRIAGLSETLTRIEEAVGSRVLASTGLVAASRRSADGPATDAAPDDVIEHEEITQDLPRDDE